MRFLPIFLDVTQGIVGLIGSGPADIGESSGCCNRRAAECVGMSRTSIPDEHARDVQSGLLEICSVDPSCRGFLRSHRQSCPLPAIHGTPTIAARARACRVPINVVDRPELSTFIFPAIIDRGDVVVAVGTGGASPVLARRLRERIEALLPARIGDFAALMGRFRRARRAKAVRQTFVAPLLGNGGRWSDRRCGARWPLALGGSSTVARKRTSRPFKSAIRIGRARRRRPGRRRPFNSTRLASAASRRRRLL